MGKGVEVKRPLGLAILAVFLTVIIPLPDYYLYQFFVVTLGVIAGIYVGFAITNSNWTGVFIEFLGANIFTGIAIYALNENWHGNGAVALAGGYFLHGVWDMLHHSNWRILKTPVNSWYPPFCSLYDVIIAIYILWRFYLY